MLERIRTEEHHAFVTVLTESVEQAFESLYSAGEHVVTIKNVRDLLNSHVYDVVIETLQQEFTKLFEEIIESRQGHAVARVQAASQQLVDDDLELQTEMINRINGMRVYVDMDDGLYDQIKQIDEVSQAKVKALVEQVHISEHLQLRTDQDITSYLSELIPRIVATLVPPQVTTRAANDVQSKWWGFFKEHLVKFMNDTLQNIIISPDDGEANAKSLKQDWKKLKRLCSEAATQSKKIGNLVAPTWTKTCRDAFIPPQKFNDKPSPTQPVEVLGGIIDLRKLAVSFRGDGSETYDVLRIERIVMGVNSTITVTGTGNAQLGTHLKDYSASLKAARAGNQTDREVLDPIVMCVVPQNDTELERSHGKKYWNLLLRDIDNEQENVGFCMFIVVHRKHYPAVQKRLCNFESTRGFVCVVVLETDCVPDIPEGSWMIDFEKVVRITKCMVCWQQVKLSECSAMWYSQYTTV